jgi:GDP-L-fucose synthase
MLQHEKILVTGGTGLVGSAIIRALVSKGYNNLIATYHSKNPSDCFEEELVESEKIEFIKIDLTKQVDVENLFLTYSPDFVFMAAAKVGGILANHTHRANFIYDNLQIQNNIIHYSFIHQVKKLIFLGSTCIYPRDAQQPINEKSLMTGSLEYTSEPYGVAKIAGIKMCESYNLQYGTNFLSVMPTNLYGENDNYDLNNSHFLPAFFRKMFLSKCLMDGDVETIKKEIAANPLHGFSEHLTKDEIVKFLEKFGIVQDIETKEVTLTLWGTGTPRRELMHSDDMADACIYIMNEIDFDEVAKYEENHYSYGIVKHEIKNTQINIGLGYDFQIKEIAALIAEIVGFTGRIKWDATMPDGTIQKLTDTSKLSHYGWKSSMDLKKGLNKAFFSYKLGLHRQQASLMA